MDNNYSEDALRSRALALQPILNSDYFECLNDALSASFVNGSFDIDTFERRLQKCAEDRGAERGSQRIFFLMATLCVIGAVVLA